MTRKRKRESDVTSGQDPIPAPEPEPDGPPAPEAEYVPETPPPPDSGGEEEVEGMLGRPAEPHPPASVGETDSTVYARIGDLEHMNLQYPSSGPPSPEPMDVDDPPLSVAATPGEPVSVVNVDEDVSAAVAPSRFYGPAPESRRENSDQVLTIDEEDSDQVLKIEEDDEDGGEGPNISSEADKTQVAYSLRFGKLTNGIGSAHIFIFDSLGSQHRQAANTLAAYLALEAKDKKHLEESRAAISKSALVSAYARGRRKRTYISPAQVPIQPNYCDCGVYVLHFVRVFIGNPETYTQLILVRI